MTALGCIRVSLTILDMLPVIPLAFVFHYLSCSKIPVILNGYLLWDFAVDNENGANCYRDFANARELGCLFKPDVLVK